MFMYENVWLLLHLTHLFQAVVKQQGENTMGQWQVILMSQEKVEQLVKKNQEKQP